VTERPMTERPIADGVVEQGPDGSTQIRFERRLPHPIERVWRALTDPAELRSWWGDADLDLTEGGRFALRWRNTDEHGDAATLDGAISKLDPPHLLEISGGWGSTAGPDLGTRTTLTWELEADDDQTVLRFTNTVAPPPQDPRTAAGWHFHLDALATALAGGEVDLVHLESSFAPIDEAYSEKYGPGSGGSAANGSGASGSGASGSDANRSGSSGSG
jgi:uncharacterized protein YndB with AHSA1/START domain